MWPSRSVIIIGCLVGQNANCSFDILMEMNILVGCRFYWTRLSAESSLWNTSYFALGIKPQTFEFHASMLYHWSTETLFGELVHCLVASPMGLNHIQLTLAAILAISFFFFSCVWVRFVINRRNCGYLFKGRESSRISLKRISSIQLFNKLNNLTRQVELVVRFWA